MAAGRSAAHQAARHRDKAVEHRRKAEWHDRRAVAYALGEAGEQLVGAQLDLLRVHGWDVAHDVRWPGRPRANIDHVAVGPGGILVVDAKNWSGSVSVRHGVLRQNGRRRGAQTDGVARAAAAVAELLNLPWALHVVPVLCLAGEGGGPAERVGRTTVLSAADLVAWATALPAQLTPGDVLTVAGVLRGAMHPAAARVSTGSSRSARRPAAAGGRRRRSAPAVAGRPPRASGVRALGLRLALLLAAVVCAPFALNQMADSLATASGDAPEAAVAAPTVAAPAVYRDCGALRAVYPDGVKATGAANAGRKARPVSAVDTALATANGRLDDDGDGLVCERLRPRHRAAEH
jgi:hypothetical protein